MRLRILCLALLGMVLGHEMDMGSDELVPVPYEHKHLHGVPKLETDLTPAERLYWENYNTTTFFTTDKGNRSAFRYHVVTLGLVTLVTYPICLVLNGTSSNWYLLALFGNLVLTVSSLASLLIFSVSFPESWYPHNFYYVTSWTLFALMLLHFVAATITVAAKKFGSGYVELQNNWDTDEESLSIPLQELHEENNENQNISGTDGFRLDVNTKGNREFSNATDISTPHSRDLSPGDASLEYSSGTNIDNNYDFHKSDREDIDQLLNTDANAIHKERNDKLLLKFSNVTRFQSIVDKFGLLFSVIFQILNIPMLIFLLVDVCTGVAIGNLLGKGPRIFNLLAHWIKGAVFFLLGVLSLARYCGVGQKYGWAWNKLIVTKNSKKSQSFFFRYSPKGGITLESFESFLIFFYGSTNIFLEHLAGSGGAWTAKDLQHVSIAFMYFGTGLCGLLVEFYLNEWKFKTALKGTQYREEDVAVAHPGYSSNPFPTFTIFWTGILMSQHAQASETSTSIHIQWGNLLSYGSFFRLFTFLLLYFSREVTYEPFKPITELVSSFCLLSGGFIFMESTDQVVEGFEYRGFTPMFTFNVSVGFIAFFMSWEMLLLLWKKHLDQKK
ncbi:Tvs1p RNJ42_03404 [Nakaseomyces bracarensis]|uniref:Tvs1p n=1 Tax=Nakaseomyces bracarensis TaxID=273131 RepID=UPI0038713158